MYFPDLVALRKGLGHLLEGVSDQNDLEYPKIPARMKS
jgi:hypothetical protein